MKPVNFILAASPKILLLAGIYFLLGVASQQLAIPPGYASAVFPAAGVALAVILHSGYRLLPGIWTGSFCLNLWIASCSGGIDDKTILIAAIVASGATLQTGVAALLIRRLLKGNWHNLDSDTDIIRFLLLAGPVACLISSSWATVTLTMSGVISDHAWLFNWSNWWVGDSVGAMLFAPLTLILLQRRGHTEKSRITNVAIPTLLVTAGIVALFVYVSGIEAIKVRQHIAEHGRTVSDQLKSRIISYHEVIASLDNYLQATPDINRLKFERYTQSFFEDHPDLMALSWNPLIPQKSRRQFEQTLSNEYSPARLTITERNLQNQLVSANVRDQYVAIGYISPLQSNRKALGFDILSNPMRAEAIERAINSGQMAATAPIQLVQDSTANAGVLLLHPVYRNHTSATGHNKIAPRGFAVGVFRIDKMLSELAVKSIPAELAFSLHDTAAPSENQTLYRLNVNRPLLSEYTWESDVAIGGRAWHITLSPTRAYLEENRSFLPWIVLAAGLTLVSLLQAFLLAITGRTSIVQRTVDQQTQILLESEQRLRKQNEKNLAILHNASDGIHLLNASGDLIEASDSFFTMLGYQREEMINMHVSQWDALLTVPELAQTIQLQFEKKERSQFQTVHRRKDGSTLDVEISSFPLELDGEIVLFYSSRDITARRIIEASLQQQLMFTRALNTISRTFVEQEENALLLTRTVVNVGAALGADRALIYDINFETQQIIGLSEYLNPEHADITATLATYPLQLFFGGASEIMSTHRWLISQRDDIEPHLALDGSGDILHRQMNIQSLLWYPFAFHNNGFHLLALNHIHAKKIWSAEELEFIESVSHLVSFELEKIRLTDARKCADAERDRLLKIIEDAPDFIATCDMQNRLKYLNAAGAKLVGLPDNADLSALKISDMHPEWATQKMLNEDIPVVLEQGVWQGETALLHRDGHETPASQVLLVHRDADGNPEYLSTIIRDISGLKKYEKALLNNEQNLLNILKLSPIAVRIAVERGQKVAFCNPRYADLIKSEDPLGDTPTKYYANVADYHAILDELAKGNSVLNRMVELNIPGGTTTWALASYMPMQYDGADAVLGWFYDISDRKQAETELLRSNIELEQFSYAISHDMRQPLRMISSYLQLLEMSLADQLNDENRDYIQYAVEGAKRIDQMLIALLEYSRVGRMNEDKAWHESRTLLDEALLFLQPAISETQAKITLSGDWPPLFANGDEITRLLQNLIGNAVKYRIAGRPPEINLDGVRVNHEWHLCISDNGIGIAPGQIKRLFQVFQRLQSREVYQGTGIGLALCRKIAEHHGGRIWVESSGEGMGSRFFVALPLTDL